MDQNSSENVCLSLRDPVDELGLSKRTHNALRRAGIQTIEDLVLVIDTGYLPSVRNIGKKAISEIEDCLASVQFVDSPETIGKSNALPSDDTITQREAHAVRTAVVPVIPEKLLQWQADLIKRQIAAGLLHEHARIAGNSLAYWLSAVDSVGRDQTCKIMTSILGDSINICEELSLLFDQFPHKYLHNYITVLLSRHGFETKTLEEVGMRIGVTRERVRQIRDKTEGTVGRIVSSAVRPKSISDLDEGLPLLRIQSALLIAEDLGMDITYEQWEHSIRASGLVGSWISLDYTLIDPIEAMIAVCRLMADRKIGELNVPANLGYAVKLAAVGTPDLPARIMHVRMTLSKEVKRKIQRHARYSGGVHARWLSQETERSLTQTKDILRALGYRMLARDWFVPGVQGDNCQVSAHDVFHHALRKMFRYCGRLSIDDVCSGIRCAAWRTRFPVPPPDVMGEVMMTYGYECEKGLYCWDGEISEELSASEEVIMGCLKRCGLVVHHSELAQAFVDSELSFPSLHMTLNRSPLFERIGTGLYKLRGTVVTRQDVGRAEAVAQRIPVDPEIEYDMRGNIVVYATLSVLAVGTGAVFCEQFPNLSGEWDCYVHGKLCGRLYATENEFRHLVEPFESLGCVTGDRLEFTFNTWKRTVTIEKAGH
jgi:hypothetical protein